MCDEVDTLTGSPLQHEDCPMLSTESIPLDGGGACGFKYSGGYRRIDTMSRKAENIDNLFAASARVTLQIS